MNTVLKSFIDNMFANMPNNTEIKRLKESLLSDMQEKYQAQLIAGLSENEAVGIVISEFGSIDEILESYDIKTQEISLDTAHTILNAYKKYSLFIAAGVLMVLMAVATLLTLLDIYQNQTDMKQLAPIGFILVISPSVACFVFAGIKLNTYQKMLSTPFNLSYQTADTIKQEQTKFQVTYATGITLGVVLSLIGVALFAIGMSLDDRLYYLLYMGFLLIGIGVALFIRLGNTFATYNVLLKIKKHGSQFSEKTNPVIELIASIYWPLIVATYLLTSFIWQLWGVMWILFPIGGIIFGVIAVIVDYHMRKK